MHPDDKERIAASLAKLMAMMCVRNTGLESLHAGVVPVSLTGDNTDVFVLDGEGRKIPWSEVSHFDDDVMRDLMREIVNRLYTFHLSCDDPEFLKQTEKWMSIAAKWDEPELDRRFLGSIRHKADERFD